MVRLTCDEPHALQHDVTAKVVAERHLALVMEAEHRLLEQLFPKHILQNVTEEWMQQAEQAEQADRGTAAGTGPAGSNRHDKPAAAARAGEGASAGEGALIAPSPTRAPAATANAKWRPVVRDCNALATWHPEVRTRGPRGKLYDRSR